MTPMNPTPPLSRPVTLWLCLVIAMIGVMVMLGGVTRLTQSGLSMVDWRPLMGIIPPLNALEWEDAFAAYRQYPEYKALNYGMTLAEFKAIFYMEYAHRVWGRLIGLAYLLPLLWFLMRGALGGRHAWQLGGIFVLGALQGLMGWIMVQSGLDSDPSVSPYRLTAHLALAIVIMGLLFLMVLRARLTPAALDTGRRLALIRPAGLALVLGALTILSGGFVAGLDAGMTYNTFPLMDGRLIPEGLLALEPVWRNPFENITMVQFNHRLLGVATALAVLFLWFKGRKGETSPRLSLALNLVLIMALAQPAFGIMTLLFATPVTLAAMHQTGALVLLGLIIWVAHELGPRKGHP